jgi:hypothetical protein
MGVRLSQDVGVRVALGRQPWLRRATVFEWGLVSMEHSVLYG